MIRAVPTLVAARRPSARLRVAGVLALSFAVPLTPLGQGLPDFSGTWTLVEAKSDPPPSGRSGRGASPGRGVPPGRGFSGTGGPVTIKQTASEITIGLTTYKLDGSMTTLEGRGGQATSSVRWEGMTLVTETTRNIQGLTLNTTEVRTLSPDGMEMTVVTTTKTPQGTLSRKMVFSKS
jgi:hypothetical protein